MLLTEKTRKRLKYSRYTLLEMMVVIALTGLLLNAALFFYYNGSNLSRQYSDKALMIRSTSTAKSYFRNFVYNYGKPFLVKPTEIIFNKTTSIFQQKNQLIFCSGTNKKIISLPKKLQAVFSQENPSGESPLLILNLTPLGKKDKLLTYKATRIVAVIPETGDKK